MVNSILFILFKFWIILNRINAEEDLTVDGADVHLILCCSKDTFYRPWLDLCRHGMDGVVPSLEIPSNRLKNVTESGLQVCPKGTVYNSSTEFHLHGNGTLQVNFSSGGLTFQPGEFCLNEILTEESSSVGPQWAARFCIPEENYCGPESKCIRKCCPIGMVFNKTGRYCQRYDSMNITEYLPETFDLRGGLGPQCPDEGRRLLDEYNFHILVDGRLNDTDFTNIYLDDEERITQEFCVDHFLLEDQDIPTIKVMRCAPKDSPALTEEDQTTFQIYPYFLIASSIFVFITLIIYALLPELRDIHGVSIMCYLGSLGATFVILSIIMLAEIHQGVFCTCIAVVLHFTCLAAFSWLNVVCFDIFVTLKGFHRRLRRTFSDLPRTSSRFVYYSLYGWGVPSVIVIVGQIMDNIKNLSTDVIKPHLGVWTCWFYKGNLGGMWLFLYGPLSILIGINIILFILTASHLYRVRVTDTVRAGREHWTRFVILVSLFIVMGVSWVTEIITFAISQNSKTSFEAIMVTDIFNILTGFYVFIIFVCKPSVWKMLKKKFLPRSKREGGIEF